MKRITHLLLVILLFTGTAKANISQLISAPGQITGEPLLGKHFTVLSEQLFLDLSKAAESGSGHVTAVYQFHCDTDAAAITLIFVANNMLRNNYRILLDGKTVHGDTVAIDSIPAYWKVPEYITGEHTCNMSLQYEGYSNDFYNEYIQFTIPADSGKHELKVDYDAELKETYYCGYTIGHAMVYMLSPARDWKGYQSLELKIAVPNDWKWETNLKLKNENGFLVAQWDHLPANYIYFLTKAKDDNAELISGLFCWSGWILSTIFAAFILLHFTRSAILGKRRSGFVWSAATWLALIWVALFCIVLFLRVPLLELIYAEQLSPEIGHGDSYVVMAVPFLWVFSVCGLYVIQSIGYLIMRKQKENIR